MQSIDVQWTFRMHRTAADEQVVSHSRQVMDQLLELEKTAGIRDSAVSLDTSEDLVVIGLSSSGTTYEDAVALAMSSIRAAIHAAAESTPDWPSHRAVMSLEPLTMNASPA